MLERRKHTLNNILNFVQFLKKMVTLLEGYTHKVYEIKMLRKFWTNWDKTNKYWIL